MDIMRRNETRYILLVILSICFLATGGILVKLSNLPPINTGLYRVLFSIPMLLPFVWKELLIINKKDLKIMFLAGMFLAGDLSLWNISFSFTSVANANLLANFTPFIVIPVSYFVFKERLPKHFYSGAVLTIIGVITLMIGKIEPSINNFFGDLLALLTSIFYASFLLTVYKLRDRISSLVIMFISAFGTAFVLLIVICFTEGVQVPTTIQDLLPLLGLALMSQIMGQGLLAYCLGKVNATLSSLICLMQPIVASIYAYVLFGEVLSLLEISGMIICIFGVYLAKKNINLIRKNDKNENRKIIL